MKYGPRSAGRDGAFGRQQYRPEQIAHAPRDGGRRIEKIDRPRRERAQPPEQQRIVGAGEHDGVGAHAVVVNEAGGDFGGECRVVNRLAGQFRLGVAGERREPTSVTWQSCA